MITKLIFSKNVESSAMVAHKNPTLLVLLAFGNYFIIYKNFWKSKLLLHFLFGKKWICTNQKKYEITLLQFGVCNAMLGTRRQMIGLNKEWKMYMCDFKMKTFKQTHGRSWTYINCKICNISNNMPLGKVDFKLLMTYHQPTFLRTDFQLFQKWILEGVV